MRSVLRELELDALTLDEACARISDLVGDDDGGHVVTANVDHVVLFADCPAFRQAYGAASLRLIDGAPVAAVMSMMSKRLAPRATGADLLPALCERAASEGWRVLFAGGPVGTASRAADQMRIRNPGLRAEAVDVGSIRLDGEGESARVLAEEIGALKADLVFLGLGTPKQELFVQAHREALRPSVVISCGAAIPFAAGTLHRAPSVLRRMGLEWLYRLWREPRRLWRRYLVRDLRFVWIAVQALLPTGGGSR